MPVTSAPSDFALGFADLLDPPPAPPAVTLGQAARDPVLLRAAIDWWPAQLDMLDSLDSATQFHIWAIGRQAGKTSMAAAAAIHNAALRPDLDRILPRGRIRYILIAGVSQSQSVEFLRVCKGMLAQIPALEAKVASNLSERMEFDLGDGRRSCIRAMPTWSTTVRGLSASLLVFDEFAHLSDTAGPGADAALYGALTPTLRAFASLGRTLVVSTPNGRSGKFFQLFEDASGGVLPSARAVQGAVWEVVPSVDQKWLDSQRAEMGEALYAQEYEASFVESGGSFFDLTGIEFPAEPAYPEQCSSWVCAVDPAFHADGFGYALVGESLAEPGLMLVGPVGAVKPEGEARSFDARRGREDRTLEAVWDQIAPYSPRSLLTDQHQASAITSYFGRRGVPVEAINITGAVQSASFVSLRARLVDGSLRCWREALLLEELRRVRAKDGGKVFLPRYGDSHCDAAVALALAVWSFEEGGGPLALVRGQAPQSVPTRSYGPSEFS